MIQNFPGQTAVYVSSPYGRERSCKKSEKSLARFLRNPAHGPTDRLKIRSLPSTDVENCNVPKGRVSTSVSKVSKVSQVSQVSQLSQVNQVTVKSVKSIMSVKAVKAVKTFKSVKAVKSFRSSKSIK